MNESISFKVNERSVSIAADRSRPLLWVLRNDLGLTGTKCGCGKGLCGACTVIVGDRAVRSCIVPVGSVKGKEVLTIEGLEKNGKLHPIQEAFVKHDALQCGFCTPGMILNAYLRIDENGRATCFTGKIEMGQGPVTSLAQTLADELDISLDSVDMVMKDTARCPYDTGTWGSMTTPYFEPVPRAAGA